jgi:5-methyltetrahydrofolate--homocysteine methyltransferase
MTDLLSRLLAQRDWLMADGATGTNLFNMGLSSGEPPELWNTDQPDNIRRLYSEAVDAGSDIFLTNTFGGNAARLKLHDAQGRVRELNRVGAALGREIADAAGRPVVVAGSVGPTGEIFEPMGTLTHALAVEIFHEQAEGLKEGGDNQCSGRVQGRGRGGGTGRNAVVWHDELRHRRAHDDGRDLCGDGGNG